MGSSNERDWREDETIGAAARRLLAEWDERIAKKKAAERLEASAQIRDQPAVSLAKAENADGEKSALGTLDPRRQQSTVAEGGRDNGLECGGRAVFGEVDYVFEKIRPKDTARPALDASLTRVDRTFRHAPEDGE